MELSTKKSTGSTAADIRSRVARLRVHCHSASMWQTATNVVVILGDKELLFI